VSKTPKMVVADTLKLVCLLGLAVILSACQSYRDGSSRTPGQFTDDARIQAGVKTALFNDADISAMSINVEVARNIVSLYGRISSEALRGKAIEIAGRVRGVERVEDRLTLVVPK
jgi:osmotically-inducible protein OsmY